jgi:hypothetical protein
MIWTAVAQAPTRALAMASEISPGDNAAPSKDALNAASSVPTRRLASIMSPNGVMRIKPMPNPNCESRGMIPACATET